MQYNPTLHKLSNGVTVILDPMDIETSAVKVHFKTGSRDEGPHEYGLTHFCEHMLCAGTPRFKSANIRHNCIESLGGISNAGTSGAGVQLEGRIIGENLSGLLDVFADQLQNSLFDPQKIELERTAILDERRRAMCRGGQQMHSAFSKQLYGNDITGLRTLGAEENIKSFTREQMLNWVARRFSAKNCVIVISGKIMEPDKIVKQLERDFVFLPTFDVSQNLHLSYNPVCYHYVIPKSANVQIEICVPRQYDAGDEPAHAAHIMWLRYLAEEINNVLRYQYGLVYGVGSSVASLAYDVGCHIINTETGQKDIAKVIELMACAARDLSTSKFLTDDWVKRCNRAYQLGNADFLDSATQRCDKLLAEYCLYGTLYDFYKRVEICQAMTAKDVKKITANFWQSPISIMTGGPNFEANLAEIWNKNFPESSCGPVVQQKIGGR